MRRRVEVSGQVRRFVRSLAPEPRKELRAALRDLAREHGDIKHLEGPLQDYFRLRIRDYRIIFQYAREGKTIQCLFAERRSLIYEIFERTIHEKLFGPLSE